MGREGQKDRSRKQVGRKGGEGKPADAQRDHGQLITLYSPSVLIENVGKLRPRKIK